MDGKGDSVHPGVTAGGAEQRLDELLGQLQAHLDAVSRGRERVHSLLKAVLAVVGTDLELDTVLKRIVEWAAALVDARYGALGVVGEGGHIAQFISVGMDEETVRRIGAYPHGRGVLGLLIEEPRMLRLPNISEHPSSCGFPRNHPPMKTFLGAPIRIREETFGIVYLAEKEGGQEFGAEDEVLLKTLATAAGVAIDDARLYDQSRRREQWLQAITDITRSLLSGEEPGHVLTTMAAHARGLSGADAAFLALSPVGSKHLVIEAADGVDAERLTGVALPLEASLAGHVCLTGDPEILTDLGNADRTVYHVASLSVTGPAVYVPLGRRDTVRGVLAVLNRPGRPTFGPTVLGMLDAFADQAAVALELARRRIDAERLVVLEDRDRIARDLHDLVIQRLYATGMSLSGVSGVIESADIHGRVTRAVDDLDETMRDIRAAIFALQPRHGSDRFSLRAGLLRETSDAADALGFTPSVRFDGTLDTEVPDGVGQHLLVVLREALSNAAQHANASHVDVSVTAAGGQVTLSVEDDGVGIPEKVPRSGLRNLEQRAADLNGTLQVVPRPERGTTLTWHVPLRDTP